MFKGYRTYILGAVTIIGAIAAYLVGDTTLTDTVNLVVTAGMGVFIRSGIVTALDRAVK